MSQTPATPTDDSYRAMMIEEPPHTIGGILKRLGPGLIIAGSIVGSGELIATTATGAEAGFWLLWLIIIGCVIKVFVQVEFGRYSIVTSETALKGMSEVPGPRAGKRGNWLVWYWVAMFLVGIGQLGGIVGGVGQAMAISWPITEEGRRYNEQIDAETKYTVAISEIQMAGDAPTAAVEERLAESRDIAVTLGPKIVEARLNVARDRLDALRSAGETESAAELEKQLALAESQLKQHGKRPERIFTKVESADASVDLSSLGRLRSTDDKIWAGVMTAITVTVLLLGRYLLIQNFATVLVAGFTLITIVNLFALQSTEIWAVSWGDLQNGMSFSLGEDAMKGMSVALSAFGIIGVGASELVSYPYWCIEKGYARFTGPREATDEWKRRAQGWMRVMRWDCWLSMVVYTFATVAFYLLGAAVLHRSGLNPEGTEMVRTLAVMYEPVFGAAAQVLFLFGAFAVLYSTFFVSSASYSRTIPDALRVVAFIDPSLAARRRWQRIICVIFPITCFTVYCFIPKPKALVLASGFMQAVMLPMLAGAALYFRYNRSDRRISPGRLWDIFLWTSAAGLLISGGWALWDKINTTIKLISG